MAFLPGQIDHQPWTEFLKYLVSKPRLILVFFYHEELKAFALTGNAVPPVAYLLAVPEIGMIEALSMMMKHFVDMAIEQTAVWKAAQYEIAGGGG